MDRHVRALAKAATYRALGFVATVTVVWLVTGRADLAGAVGVLDSTLKLAGYYAHERFWDRIKFGRTQLPDRHI